MNDPQNIGNNTFKDHRDQVFTTPNNQPPLAGTRVNTPDGAGIWNGDQVIKDKK